MKKGDLEWYKQCWDSRKIKQCDECGKALREFSPAYISHILTKGAWPKFRHHPRNFMLYCYQCHQRYEFGSRNGMKTESVFNKIANELKQEYYADRL